MTLFLCWNIKHSDDTWYLWNKNIHTKLQTKGNWGKQLWRDLRQCNCYYLALIYDISYDCDNVCVLFFWLMMDDDSCLSSSSYRSQTAWPNRFAGTRGTKRGSVWFRPKHRNVNKFVTKNALQTFTLFNLLLRLWCLRSPVAIRRMFILIL